MSDTLAMFWADHPELAARQNKVPVTYAITYAPLAALAVQAPGQFIAAEAFVCTRILGIQTTAATNAAYILTPLVMQLVITARNMNFNSVKTEWSTAGIETGANVTPTGGELPYPLSVPKGMQLSTLVDNPQAVAANVWITFLGIQCNS